MQLFQALGINWTSLLAQAVNFGILFFVLYRFLYKPILKMLTERTEKIEKGLKDAELIEARLVKVEEEREELLAHAKEDAEKIINQSRADNDELKKLIIIEAEKKSDAIINNAKKEIDEEKKSMIKGIRREIAGLVDASLQIIIEDKKDKIDEKLVNEAIAAVAEIDEA